MSSIYQTNNKLIVDGKEIEKPKSIFFQNTVCQINDKLYVNGKQFKNGKWRYTLKSLFYSIF